MSDRRALRPMVKSKLGRSLFQQIHDGLETPINQRSGSGASPSHSAPMLLIQSRKFLMLLLSQTPGGGCSSDKSPAAFCRCVFPCIIYIFNCDKWVLDGMQGRAHLITEFWSRWPRVRESTQKQHTPTQRLSPTPRKTKIASQLSRAPPDDETNPVGRRVGTFLHFAAHLHAPTPLFVRRRAIGTPRRIAPLKLGRQRVKLDCLRPCC